uniref:Uncharacterized protein n=1 Tax=Timema shepardi TaxID=629360 RepID=A0A7R9G4E9_TIMSH|nr:unnamed protein product [Timema shepardi]
MSTMCRTHMRGSNTRSG